MFITTEEINKIRDAENDKLIKTVIGTSTYYFFLIDEDKNVCSVPCYFVGMRNDKNSKDKNSSFFINIAIETPVSNVYTYLKNIEVFSILIEEKDGLDNWYVCKSSDLKEVTRILNSKFNGPHLTLVPNKKDLK